MENNTRNGRLHQYLLYTIIIIVAMISWFLNGISVEVNKIKSIQLEQMQRVESISELRYKIDSISIQIASMSYNEATFKRHEETLRRLEDAINNLYRATKNPF